MSELKSFIVHYNGKFIRAYKQNEVDKVIAEKDAEIAALKAAAKEPKELIKLCKRACERIAKEIK